MYEDVSPCQTCGAEVRLEPRDVADIEEGRRVGPADGVVGGGDPTLDERVCTNPDCPSNAPGSEAEV